MTTIDRPATPTEIHDRLWHGIPAARLPHADIPEPSQLICSRDREAVVTLHDGADLTDLHTWACWLRAPGKFAETEANGVRTTTATATWRGWTIHVRLVQREPIETVAVAYGQTGGAR